MKLPSLFPRWWTTAFSAALLALLSSTCALPPALGQQVYQNISNQHFRTISNGPQSALIVDVTNPADKDGVRRAAHAQYTAKLQSQRPALQQEWKFLQQHRLIRPGQNLVVADAAIVRSNGRLALPPVQRGRAGNDITFTFPTDASVTGHWSVQDATKLSGLTNLLYPELKTLLGAPGWSGNVTVLNLDPRLGKVDEVIGALLIINGTDVTIDFPSFGHDQDQFLAMAQVMAQAFHGPLRIAYDAWEQGMARAASVVAAQDIQTFNGTALDPANGFFYTPAYDLLNQRPLANNTFTPPTKSGQAFSTTTLSGMLVPRLQMSSTAWLKCYIENHSFFQQFNTAYYAAYAADPTVANDTNRLRGFAKQADSMVELQDFDAWFEQQFVLDTSVTPGPKLYAYIQPTFPSTSAQGNDSGAAIFLVYYQTTGTGDETDLSGTSQIVYWDYSFSNRLFLPSFDTVTIANGFGTVAPFFTSIGGNPADMMRVAIDFPVNKEVTRLYFPAGQTGTEAAPNAFSGVTVGANGGNLSVGFDNGTNINTTVVQGEFGGKGSTPTGFSRTRLIFTPDGSANAITYQRNVYLRQASDALGGVEPIFQLIAPGPTVTLSHTFPSGPQMIALPFKPLTGDLAKVLGADPTQLLLAQYRQDLQVPPNPDKYARYPSLPLYQPGYSLWSSFATNLAATGLTGESTDIQQDISVPLQFGWNQIGSPYTVNLGTDSSLFVQYLGGDVLSIADAIARGYIATGIVGYSSTTGYNDITTTTDPNIPKNTLEAWKGYWIRVIATEGVTLTYVNPNAPTRSARFRTRAASTPARDPGGWRVPLMLKDGNGNTTGAVLGQSAQGSDSFVAALDVASPPPFTRAATPAVRFPHADWNDGINSSGGDFLTDIRRTGSRSQWEVTVTLPAGEQDYTLAWSNAATIPHGTRLTLVDVTSGARRMMNTTSSYGFRAAKSETTRRFQVIAEPRASNFLQIRNVRVDAPQGRAAGLTISYELTANAESSVEIHLGGRTVRRLAQGRAAAAGVSQIVWDGKDDQGRGLPTGSYTLQVTARTPEGEQTRQILPIQITR